MSEWYLLIETSIAKMKLKIPLKCKSPVTAYKATAEDLCRHHKKHSVPMSKWLVKMRLQTKHSQNRRGAINLWVVKFHVRGSAHVTSTSIHVD